jgi:ABC-type sugar transport system ATPase subunit
VSELSGGNQQKVIIASAVASDPQVLVVEEPTRGVDIQSRYEIYALLRGFVNRGRAAIVFCTEETEAFEVADACLVFAGHSVAGRIELSGVGSVRELVDAIADLEETAGGTATETAG